MNFTANDAASIVQRLRTNSFRKHQGGLTFMPQDATDVRAYSAARRQLGACEDLSLVGFKIFEPHDAILSAEEAAKIIEYCNTIQWEPRRGSNGRLLHGTERKNFGVDMDDSYRVLSSSTGQLPPLLDALGKRILEH